MLKVMVTLCGIFDYDTSTFSQTQGQVVLKYFPNTSLYYPKISPLFYFTCGELIITNY